MTRSRVELISLRLRGACRLAHRGWSSSPCPSLARGWERHLQPSGHVAGQEVPDHPVLADRFADVVRSMTGAVGVQLDGVVPRPEPFDIGEDLPDRTAAVVLAGQDE